jgi:type II secretory pathway component PulL
MRVFKIDHHECFFGLLDDVPGRGSERLRELGYQFEGLVPLPIDELQVAYAKLENGKVVACGCPVSMAQQHRSKAEVLIPDILPDWMEIDLSDAQQLQLNMLTGKCRPVSVIKRNRSTSKLVTAVSIACVVLMILGLQRRIDQASKQHDVITGQIDEMYSEVLPVSSGSSAQPQAIQFQTLLNETRSTRTEGTGMSEHDLVHDLAQFLGDWPGIEGTQVQSVVLGPDLLSLKLSAPDNDSATQLIQVISDFQDWNIQNRSTTPRSDSVDLDLTISRAESRGGSS